MSEQQDQRMAMYTAYLEDLGRIGGRHENVRKFYLSVISALYVFLSMAGGQGLLVNVKGAVFMVVAVAGIVVCITWLEHMRSFRMLYSAKFHTLRAMETALKDQAAVTPFTTETAFLLGLNQQTKPKWSYSPLTLLDTITPLIGALLFIALLFFAPQ